MSLALFLVDVLPVGPEAVLDGVEGHHAADVARLRVGQQLLLGDGKGGTVTAVVRSAGRGRLDLSVQDRRYADQPSPRLVVVQGIAKGDRGELAVQAMTEVGVDEIVPWSAARSVSQWRGDKQLDRWRATAREAAKQARRPWRPLVTGPASTAAIAGRVTLVLHEEAEQSLATVPLPATDEIVLVVGPEGGIAPEELAAFTAGGATAVRMGGTVLRTSTAGVAALAVLCARLGRW